jgi:DNA polymerase/3'-5' exonuclease PolX
MSNNENRIQSGEAWDIECDFEIMIQNYCERIEVAGSLRRGLPDVGDIEIVAQPRYGTPTMDVIPLFHDFENDQDGDKNLLHEELVKMLENEEITLDRPRKDTKKNPFGKKYYRLNFHTQYDGEWKTYPVDLFVATPPADYNVIYLIRTGSANFSRNFVSQGWKYGIHVKDGHLEKDGMIIPTTSEKDVFEKMHVPYKEPKDRV